jgi:hypothetical protein
MARWTTFATAATCFALTAFAPAALAAQRERAVGNVGITVFDDINLKGRSATYRDDTPNLQSSGMARIISSLRVAPGETWEACEQPNFGGRCQVFTGTESDLRRGGWSDVIMSLRRVRNGGGNGGGRGPFPAPPLRSGIELFTGRGFAGPSRAFTNSVSNLQSMGLNDRTMSLRVAPGETWEVCADKDYKNCSQVSGDMADLNRLGMTRAISSMRPVRPTGGLFPGRGAPGIILYGDTGFRGQSMTLGGPATSLGGLANRVQSIQVTGGSWQLCDRPNFQGRCVSVSTNLSDLKFVQMNGRVMSVRPERR